MSGDRETAATLASGRQWTALPDQDSLLEWSMDPDGDFLQGPLDLVCLRGRKVGLGLDPDQVALYTLDSELRAIFLDGGHVLDIGHRQGQINPQGRLYFLDLRRVLQLRWTHGNPISLAEKPEPHIIGNCSLIISRPSRFYHHFLRQGDSTQLQNLNDIQDALEAATRQALSECLVAGPGTEDLHPLTLQTTLMNLQAETLSEELQNAGLCCTHLALYTAQPPVEDGSGEAQSQEMTGQSPQLTHN